jgi:serine/threonine-protein kinase
VSPLQILGGRYRLDEVLGVGGMSVVWRATDDVLGRAVAVKILAGEFAADPAARATVLSEAQSVARLSHPNICNVFDYGESLQANGQLVPYVVMELLTGPSLADRLEAGPLPPQEALRVAGEVAAGLAAAHAHDIVHRDVKPGNVILTPSGAKVFDFGIAALAGAPDEAGPDGQILATLSCVAPERLQGGLVLPASDMFAWGVLLFRLLTGRLPWPTWAGLDDRLSAKSPLPAIEGVPAQVGDLYLSCLAENPEDRPTAATAASVLQVAVTVRTPQPYEVIPTRRITDDTTAAVARRRAAEERDDARRRRRRAAVLALGLVALLTAGAFAFSNLGRGGGGPGASGPPGASTRGPGEDVGEAPVQTGGPVPGDTQPAPPPPPPVVVTVTANAAQQPADNAGQELDPDPQAGVTTVFVTGSPGPPAPYTFTTDYGRVTVRCQGGDPVVTEIDAAPGFVGLGPVPSLFNRDIQWVFFYGESGSPWFRVSVICDGDQARARLVQLPLLS